ncbi:MAG: hypothetical protein AAGA95_07150 [Pseudomonadota bacterium]
MLQQRGVSAAASAVRGAALILGLRGAAAANAAGVQATDGYGLIDSTFSLATVEDVQVLDGRAMADTEGELWPFIAAVVTIDVGLATFFWGTYVPTITAATGGGGGGVCPSCNGRNHIPR